MERSLDARIQGVQALDEFRPYSALSTGFYADHIGPWLEAFRSAFRVVFFEDLVYDARAVIEDICAWLEIDHAPAAHLDYGVQNRTVLPKRARLQKIAIRANTRGEKFFRRHPALKTNLRRIYYSLNADKKPMRFEPIARRRVDAIYAASNEALAAELRLRGYRRLPAWLTAKRAFMAEGSHASSG